ncbi:MAG: phosphatase PAP2 family protein [Chitinivibrionales bacterium]|nr:phosphatase PAP2 family protein [Chitinivibrionales bacterium]MBD3396338.1 phosphatase PAP2 family protein [Chitinivibrionales bacterium]
MIPYLHTLDVELFWRINTTRTPTLDSFFELFTNLGSAWVAVPVIVAVLLLRMRRGTWVHAIVFMAVAMSLSGIVNSSIKSLAGRPRPLRYFGMQRTDAIEDGADLPPGPGRESLMPHVVGPRWKHRSFPSGHANTAFSSAMVLFMLLGGWWFLAFVIAALVAYSRVYVGVHFPLDTVAGAFVGAFVTHLVFIAYHKWVYPFQKDEP